MSDIEAFYLNIPPENIVLLKSILESYDELGIIRTIDKRRGDVAVLCVPDLKRELEALLHSVSAEVGITFLPIPETSGEDWFLHDVTGEDQGA